MLAAGAVAGDPSLAGGEDLVLVVAERRTAHCLIVSDETVELRQGGQRVGRAGFIMAALDAGVPLRDVQIAARHADPRTTTIYDRRRENFDRHAAYVVVAFVAGG